jgi:sugar transferase (PEP-CTERM/EpsH1 system associated)
MRLMMIVSRFPWPLEKGDKLRAFHQLKELSKHHQVHLVCITHSRVSEEQQKAIAPYCSDLTVYYIPVWRAWLNVMFGVFSRKPFQVLYFLRFGIRKKIRTLIRTQPPDHIYCQLIRVAEYVKNEHHIPKTLDYMDALGVGMQRIAGVRKFPMRLFYQIESRRARQYESLIFNYFEHHTIISAQDRNLIGHAQRNSITVVPNGVDTDYFKATPANQQPEFDLVFIGNLGYSPNQIAASYIVEHIKPALEEMGRHVRILIAGANPGDGISSLKRENVVIQGDVNDIRQAYQNGRIFLAPMFINTGLQNKILEAMSLGIPCITSHQANNAIGANPGEHLLACTTVPEFCSAIIDLLDYPEKRRVLVENGQKFIASAYSWQSATSPLLDCFSNA